MCACKYFENTPIFGVLIKRILLWEGRHTETIHPKTCSKTDVCRSWAQFCSCYCQTKDTSFGAEPASRLAVCVEMRHLSVTHSALSPTYNRLRKGTKVATRRPYLHAGQATEIWRRSAQEYTAGGGGGEMKHLVWSEGPASSNGPEGTEWPIPRIHWSPISQLHPCQDISDQHESPHLSYH